MNLITQLAAYGGVILGSVGGIVGAAVGTWCSIRYTQSPAERQFMVRSAVGIWLLAISFLAGLCLIPQPYNLLLWIPYPIVLLLLIQWINRRQAALRAKV